MWQLPVCAVDVLAAAPLLSATTLARILGIAVKNAIRILRALVADGIAVEVTHRAKRRLFGLRGLTPLRDVVRPPYRLDPNRGRGRPRHDTEDDAPDVALPPLPPLAPIERGAFDYTALEAAMAQLDAVVRQTRQALRAIADGTPGGGAHGSSHGAAAAPADIPPADGAQSSAAAASLIRDTRPRAGASHQEATALTAITQSSDAAATQGG